MFKGPPPWNVGYKSIRSHNTAIRWVQNALSFIGFVPPDENDLVKRVIAVGGQTVQCRNNTGLTVDGKPLNEPYLDPATMNADPSVYPCLGTRVRAGHGPAGTAVGDGRQPHPFGGLARPLHQHSRPTRSTGCCAPATRWRARCRSTTSSARRRFIVWPPSRWGGVGSVNPQQNH